MIGFNVSQLLKAPAGTIRRVQVDEPDNTLAADLHLVSATRGSLRLMRTTSGILVTGQLSHSAECTCSRCLETFVRPQVIQLNEEFLPVVDVNTGLPVEEPCDPDAFKLTPNHVLDLTEAIRQLSILEEPLQPLCDVNCKGLCVSCGANLNLGPCGCQEGSEGEPSRSLRSLMAERLRQAGYKPE